MATLAMDVPQEITNNFADDICAICETTDDLKACDGYCLKSYHSDCIEVGDGRPSDDKNEYWACFDCTHGIHRCFICKEYAHDKQKSVVQCSKICGHRFHKKCILKTLRENEKPEPLNEDEFFSKYICPMHQCQTCKIPEDDDKGKLLKCFRCTAAYCRKCIPRAILELSTTKFICAKHTIESNNLGSIPSNMYKRIRPIKLEHRCRQMSKLFPSKGRKSVILNLNGLKISSKFISGESSSLPPRASDNNNVPSMNDNNSSSSSIGINDDGSSNNGKKQKAEKTIDWGNTNTTTEIVFNTPINDIKSSSPLFSDSKQNNSGSQYTSNSSKQFANIDESRFKRDQAAKRRKIMADFRKQQADEKAAAAARAAIVARNIQRHEQMVDPTRRNPQEMIIIQNKMLLKLNRWIEQKKKIIEQKRQYLKSFDD